MRDSAEPAGTEHDLVVVNEGVLVHAPEDITSRYVVANLDELRLADTLESSTITYLVVDRVEVPLQ